MRQPNAISLERAVLGGMMLDQDSCNTALSLLKPDYFYLSNNRKLFLFIEELYEEDGWLDGKLLVERLKTKGKLDDVGGIGYIAGLISDAVVGDSLIEKYCMEIERKYRLRKALSLIFRAGEEFKYAQSPEPLLERIQEILSGFEEEKNALKLSEIAERVKEIVTLRVEHPGTIGGIPTGYKDLDLILDGLHGGRLYLVAGRPGMGKSSLMICMARNMAQKGTKVGIFSLEMSAVQVFEWMVSQRAMVNVRKLEKKDLPKVLSAIEEVASLPLWIEESITWMGNIKRRASLWVKEGVEVVFLDHILLVEDAPKEPYQRVSEVSRKLKKIAKDLGVPVVALCQLSRKVEERGGDHRPRLSDLRDSGKLEENADVVMFVHRPEYYGVTPKDKPKNYAALIVEKQRDGALGTVDFVFIEEQRRFELMAKEG